MVILAGALAACGKQTETARTQEETELTGSAPEEMGDAGSAPEETGDAGSMPVEMEESMLERIAERESGYVSGTILTLSFDSLSLETEDGDQMEFGLREALLDTEADLTEGLFVTISYEVQGEERLALYLTDAPLVTGEVVDGTMGAVRIRLEDGTEMNFDKQEASVKLKEGLLIGNRITVAYRSAGDSAESGFYRALWIRDAS